MYMYIICIVLILMSIVSNKIQKKNSKEKR